MTAKGMPPGQLCSFCNSAVRIHLIAAVQLFSPMPTLGSWREAMSELDRQGEGPGVFPGPDSTLLGGCCCRPLSAEGRSSRDPVRNLIAHLVLRPFRTVVVCR